MNYSNNLFNYATSELSQDAFLCYIFSYALEENLQADNPLTQLAYELINTITSTKNKSFNTLTPIKKIIQQHLKIDVLIEIDDLYIITEDKTYSNEHNSQIEQYTKALMEEKDITKDNIITVYYKPINQSNNQITADLHLKRENILPILEKYESKVSDTILLHYLEHLKHIDNAYNNFEKLPMNKWDAYSHLGFFDYIKNNLLDGPCEYKTLGCTFKSMHLLWFNYIDTTKYSITNGIIDEIYLQFENSIESSNENIIAVKLRANPDALKDNNKKAMLNEFRSRLRKFLEKNLNLPSTSSFVKTKRKFGTTMTNDYVTYNLENYKDVMSSLQNTLDKFLLTL